jgi:hypothetical protein
MQEHSYQHLRLLVGRLVELNSLSLCRSLSISQAEKIQSDLNLSETNIKSYEQQLINQNELLNYFRAPAPAPKPSFLTAEQLAAQNEATVNTKINELNSLSEICKRIDDTIKDIKEKLHQYDIDEPCEAFDDNMLNEGNCADDDNDSVINDAVNETEPVTNIISLNEPINDSVEPTKDIIVETPAETPAETPVETPIENTLDNIEPLSIITHEADCTQTEPEKETYSYKNKRSYGRRKK